MSSNRNTLIIPFQPKYPNKKNIWNDLEKKPKDKNIFFESVIETTISFCRESTLHGIKNVVTDLQALGSSKYTRYLPKSFEN